MASDATYVTDAAALARRAADVARSAGDEVPSPCVSVCRMDADRVLCIGCLRTMAEITAWSRADAAGKRGVWRAIAMRASVRADLLRTTGGTTP
jgi:predicted Fe-S protein YdhL (DUF1289 family)